MNMDWSLCEALATTYMAEILHLLHIYDINCQYCRHLKERIGANTLLNIPEGLQIHHAIGQFHIHGHQDDCLYRWATNYVPGAGVVDGEVLETLWSVLNSVSAATRTASLAHRTETLDDHMSDNNWKKILNMGEVTLQGPISLLINFLLIIVKAIVRRHTRALENIVEARLAFDRLNDAAPKDAIGVWEASIEEAEEGRHADPTTMDVMKSRIKTGKTMKAITADIMREDGLSLSAVLDSGTSTEWLLEGLNIEDEQ
jgi:hypothetical protein